MKRILLAAAFLLTALPALAQQPDPGQIFAAEWQGKVLQEQHVADSAQALLQSYQTTRKQLVAAGAELDYWHRWCGDKPNCAQVPTE